jgi:glycerol uptake facilitator-like aquaporin
MVGHGSQGKNSGILAVRLSPQGVVKSQIVVPAAIASGVRRACALLTCRLHVDYIYSYDARRMPVTTEPSLGRRLVAEALGSALLLAVVIGSGIMAERLAGGNVAIALLGNTLATGAGLVALILTFGSISGAHFNPVVSLADASQGGLRWRDVAPYVGAQIVGAFVGVAVAHMMFGEPTFSASRHVRSGIAQLVSEFVATFGLLSVIWGCSRARPQATPFAVGAYITAAYWFTSSTSFANPAVTLARAASDTFAGIRPSDAPGFIIAQVLGAASATAIFRWLIPALPRVAPDDVVMPPATRGIR